MTSLRRLLGVFVMVSGIIGLLLSLSGLAGLWLVRPALVASFDTALTTLVTSVEISQEALAITNQALDAVAISVDTLSEMLGATAVTVAETQPVIAELNDLMGETLPTTLGATVDALDAAEVAAHSLEGAIQTFDSFRFAMATTPLLSAFVDPPAQAYNPEKPLAESLAELSESLQGMPVTFEEMSVGIGQAEGSLDLVKGNLDAMSQSVALISASLGQYQSTIDESQASMADLTALLDRLQDNLGVILNGATLVVGLFLLWLLAAQVVIFSQGWELYHGTQIAWKEIHRRTALTVPVDEEARP